MHTSLLFLVMIECGRQKARPAAPAKNLYQPTFPVEQTPEFGVFRASLLFLTVPGPPAAGGPRSYGLLFPIEAPNSERLQPRRVELDTSLLFPPVRSAIAHASGPLQSAIRAYFPLQFRVDDKSVASCHQWLSPAYFPSLSHLARMFRPSGSCCLEESFRRILWEEFS